MHINKNNIRKIRDNWKYNVSLVYIQILKVLITIVYEFILHSISISWVSLP